MRFRTVGEVGRRFVRRRLEMGGVYEVMIIADMIRGVTLLRYVCTGCVYGSEYWLLWFMAAEV